MKINQAVIFCGGFGKRLLPHTQKMPKPMLLVNNMPFVEQLIIDIKKKYNINNFLLLVGYKHKIIEEYFKKKNIKVLFSYDSAKTETGERLWNAKKKLENFFMLFYSDNLLSFNYKYSLNNFIEKKKTLNLVLKKKNKGNFKLVKKKLYYLENRNKKYPYVELGYMFVNKDKLLPILKKNKNLDFKKTISDVVSANMYTYSIHKDIYCSIGDLKRYNLANKFLKKKKLLFIDRDGFLTKKLPKARYVSSWNKIVFQKKIINLLQILSKKGFAFIIITNQAGVSRNIIKLKNLKIINKNIKLFLKKKFDINIIDIFYCPHGWESKCKCRKPKGGMFFKAAKKYNINLSNCLYVGDDPRDCIAAYNANCKSIFYGKKKELKNLDKQFMPIVATKNKVVLKNKILKYYK